MAVKADPDCAHNWTSPRERLKCELIALASSMAKNRLRSVTAVTILVAWLGWTTALGYLLLNGHSTGLNNQLLVYLLGIHFLTTAVLFTIVGRIWGYEFERILEMASDGITLSIGTRNDDDGDQS